MDLLGHIPDRVDAFDSLEEEVNILAKAVL
jgi:hypothetical protein